MRNILIYVCLFCSLIANGQNEQGKTDTIKPKVYTYVEQMPEPGYDITKYLNENLKYPDSAFQSDIQGRVILRFTVNEDGGISDCKAERGIGGGCDEEAVRVVATMPKWKAGIHNGVPVKVSCMLPVSFVLTEPDKVYTHVDQMPEMGYNYSKYIRDHIQYPDSARRNKIEGNVFVRFIVREDGTISNCTIIGSVGGGCDEEAIRLIKNMPDWQAGKQNGKPVNVWFNLLVAFELKPNPEIDTVKENMPVPPFDYQEYLNQHIYYPDSARENNLEGRVIVKFAVNENGSISDVTVVRGVYRVLDNEAIRVVKSMPQWVPGTKNGKPVKTYFTLPLVFSFDGPLTDKRKRQMPPDYIYDLTYDHVDKSPESGYDHVKYILDHVRYSDDARQGEIQGEISVRFVVYKDGSIGDCEVLNHLGSGCDSEAVRVVRSMPKWKPGINNKKAINAEYLVVVPFYSSEEERQKAEAKKIYSYVEQMPSSSYDRTKYIEEHRKYPDSFKIKNVLGGRVLVKFIITETGAIDSVRVLRGIGGGCDEEAVRVVKSMPPWNPGRQNGKPVKVYYVFQVPFEKKVTEAEIISYEKARKAAKPKRAYDFGKYIEESLRYPEQAVKHKIEGDVIVTFGVDEDGIVSNCTIKKSLGYGCDEEAIRLVKNMPRWTPGVKDGKNKIAYYTQGIIFALKDNHKSRADKKNAYKSSE